MGHDFLEEILSCPSLPSLPAVAVRVVELTSHPDVSLKEIAATIENDQGLAAKILRTVNSSFYAVPTRCATISKALVLLGLSPVKVLALGFSLVSTLESGADTGFDFISYWRRGLYTAAAAKRFAAAAKLKCEEEAFLGGLLQDVGMMAMYRALKDDYAAVIQRAGGDHGKLAKFELETFDIQHPDIGAMLAKRWKFPDELVMPVKYHERPTAAPLECSEVVRCVAIGNLVHDVLTESDPAPAMRRLYQRAQQWFKLSPVEVDDTVRKIADSIKELSSLFRLDTGAAADVEAVLKKADRQLADLSKQAIDAPAPGSEMAALLEQGSERDSLTGTLGRSGFSNALRRAFDSTKGGAGPLSLVEISIDSFKSIENTCGQEVADEVLVGLAVLLKKHFEPAGGIVCRLSADIFSAVLPRTARQLAVAASEDLRKDVQRASERWTAASLINPAPDITVSVGIASFEVESHTYEKPEQLVGAAAKAVQASRTCGGNCIRVFAPKAAA